MSKLKFYPNKMGDFALALFIGTEKIFEINLGQIEADARKKADRIIKAMKDVDGYDER